MTLEQSYSEVMAVLESYGTAQNRKVYKRHGAGDNLFGVSLVNLKKLQKQIKKDHQLAVQLWDSENTDARTLATMIAKPQEMTEAMLDKWLSETAYYVLIDLLAGNVVSKTIYAKPKMEEWMKSDDEWVGRAGWMLLAQLAMHDKDLPDSYFEEYLTTIENSIHESKNRTRDAMNNALIAVGLRNDNLEKKALGVAARIGKVDVDHGETSCKTPDAASYIKKARSRKKKNPANR